MVKCALPCSVGDRTSVGGASHLSLIGRREGAGGRGEGAGEGREGEGGRRRGKEGEWRGLVLVGIVAWMQKGNTTACRNILLLRDRSTFHEKNLASVEPWCHFSLLPLYGKVDPKSVENVYQLKKIFSRF